MTWANRITIFRIFCVPAFVTLMVYYSQSVQQGATDERFRLAAIGVFAIAAISDAIDGFLARFCNQRTELGAILDPAADKLLLLGGLIVLNFVDLPDFPHFPIWFTAIVISRDFIAIVFLVLIKYQSKTIEIRPHWSGKIATVFQFTSIVMFLFKMEWFTWACMLGGFFTVYAGVIYLTLGVQKLQD
ncbi:MAG: CDP-alcohol phosphatidyltransferase family protein [Verrucomicrobiota bacterium]